jgi:GTP cyclohydrolase I
MASTHPGDRAMPAGIAPVQDRDKIEAGVRLILEGIGDDPARDGLLDTPRRYADMCQEIFGGLAREPSEVLGKIFEDPFDELVMVRDIPFHSVCEHHLMPFVGAAHVAYIPSGHGIVGLSKLARLVEIYARRPQVQERLTAQIADDLVEYVQPQGVLVVIEAEHMCMSMRGVRKPGAVTTTSAVRGQFLHAETRNEAMTLLLRH